MKILAIVATSLLAATSLYAADDSWPIITRKADMLYEGDKPFRFMSFATPNIQQNENQLREDGTNRFPDEYEVRDILSALNRINGRATRTFSLSVYSPKDNGLAVYIKGPREYNEEAFQCLDRILAYGREYDVRSLIPFIASQSFGGIRGVDEFSAFYGKPSGSFWTDPQQKEDFKHFINYVVNRKNTVNGVIYRDEPAILGWQLGNEFGSFYGDRKLPADEWRPKILEWSRQMAAYIKSVDPNHLVVEAGGCDRKALIDDPNIDVISEHLYEYWNRKGGGEWHLSPIALRVLDECKGKKVLMIDEFGLGSNDNVIELMETIANNNISGGLMWSMRSHRRDGGWYYHNEGGTHVNSFHYPGFKAGERYSEREMLRQVQKYACKLSGIPVPAVRKPDCAPVLFINPDGLTWQGATGAANYTVERLENGKWVVAASGIEDSFIENPETYEETEAAKIPTTLFKDANREAGKSYSYRVKGINEAGDSGYSNVVVW